MTALTVICLIILIIALLGLVSLPIRVVIISPEPTYAKPPAPEAPPKLRNSK